jgi:cyclic beta-1,2-glucan synthetase
MRRVVRAQREYARHKGVPWGISESAWLGESGAGEGYAPFGIPNLALKRCTANALVIAPYAAVLALAADPQAAIKNLRQMEEFGWSGRYGYYESVDYSRAGGQVIRSWMAHHQGMSLLAICNLLFDSPIQRYFHAEPQVMATELLLQERLPSSVIAEPEHEKAIPAVAAMAATAAEA